MNKIPNPQLTKGRQPTHPNTVTRCLQSMETIRSKKCYFSVASHIPTSRQSRIVSLQKTAPSAVDVFEYTTTRVDERSRLPFHYPIIS